MHIRPEQLRGNLEALDSAELQMKLQSGRLTAEARQMAVQILQARGVASSADLASPPRMTTRLPAPGEQSSLPGRNIAKVVLKVYCVFLLACTAVMFADPPWIKPGNGTWEGMIGFLASEASGAPWSVWLLLHTNANLSSAQFVAVNFGCAVLNIALLVAYVRHAR